MKVRIGGVLAIALCVAQVTVVCKASTPLQITDLLSLVRFPFEVGPPVVISPDGSRVAYVSEIPLAGRNIGTTNTLREGNNQLWVQNVDGGSRVRIGTSAIQPTDPVWSPDGRWLAFYANSGANGKIGIWDSSARDVRFFMLTLSEQPPVIRWFPDNARILVQRSLHIPTTQIGPNRPIPSVTVLTSAPSQKRKGNNDVVQRIPPDQNNAVDLVTVNVTTGAIVTVAGNIVPTFYQLSPDGTKLCYAVNTGNINNDINDRELFDVTVVDLRSGLTTTVARDILMDFTGRMVWSHDGSKLAFIGGNLKDDAGVPPGNHGADFAGRMYVIDLHHLGMLRRSHDQRFARAEALWSNDDSTVYGFTEDYQGILAVSPVTNVNKPIVFLKNAVFVPQFLKAGNHILTLTTTNEGETQLRDLNLRTGSSKIVFHAFQSVLNITFSQNGNRAAYQGEDVAHPSDVWIAGSGFKHRYQLTYFNPHLAERSLSDTQEYVSWRSRDGKTLDGIVLLPVGYKLGKRYRTILDIYAGEKIGTSGRNFFGMFGEQRDGSYLNLQLLTGRGYAVFIPDSTLGIGNPMRDIANAILPGIDKIVAMGIADPARLGVYGQSYGGYSTMSLIVQTHRFKAAVAMSGFSDLVSEYGFLHKDGSDWTSYMESDQGRMGGTPWQYRNRYIANSPFFYLNYVQTPVLLEYGTDDSTVAPYQSQETFVALRRLNKIATLVGYTGESHVLKQTANQVDFSNRMLSWFAKYL